MDPLEVRKAVLALQDALDTLAVQRSNGLRIPNPTLTNLAGWIQDLVTHPALVVTP